MNNMSGSLGIVYTAITICVIIMIILIGVVFYVYWQNKKAREGKKTSTAQSLDKKSQTKLQGIESMSKFLAFDEIVDSMIVRKNRKQYIMVIQCKGINFDLLGTEEKIAVENGFVQFLNTLRFPIQLYIQTRSLNLKDSIEQYEGKIEQVKEEIRKIQAQIKKEQERGRFDLVKKLEFDKRRKENILEYGIDITNYVSRMSQNRDVLQQNTYVVVSYYTAEFGGDIDNYSKEEIDNIAFSELYTRTQTLIRGLSASGVLGRVINSEELAELLYIAYNRDDSELINIRKSVNAEYDSLYNIAQDVMEKQKRIIEEKVEEEAIDLTAKSIELADQIRKVKQLRKEEIRKRALEYVEKYKDEMTEDLYEGTKEQIKKADIDGSSTQKARRTIEQDRIQTTRTARTTRTEKTTTSPSKTRRVVKREKTTETEV